jgi:orotate phosphoribosyltransferase
MEELMSEVIDLLKKTGAMLDGHFLLTSGKHSDKYFQCAKLLSEPEIASIVIANIAQKINADRASGKIVIDLVAGPAMGGIIVAYELAKQLKLPAFFTERDEDGKMCLRRGFAIKPGQQILIAEDVVTTGKSSGECAGVFELLGGQVTSLACIVDRRTVDANDIYWPMYSALKVSVESWEANECPLCKQGINLVKPGSRNFSK